MKKLFARDPRQESGQTLVIVAFALIALIGFLALAIDVGVLYAWRRDMQNAADAAALAGARVICDGGTRAQAEAAIEDYATVQNRATGFDSEIDGGLVTVTTSVDAPLFFARVLGTSESGVVARAAARCGEAEGSCAMWPIAFAQTAWQPFSTGCENGAEFMIIDSNKICDECDTEACYECVDDPNEVDKFGGNRAWLDFPVPDRNIYNKTCGGGTNCLRYWMDPENPYPIPIVPVVCIDALDGTKTDALAEAQKWVGLTVAIPLFDQLVPKSYACPAPGTDLEGSGNNTNRYRIVDYACVEIVGYYSAWPLYGLDKKGDEVLLGTVKAIRVKQTCQECYQDCGSTSGGEFRPGGLSAVSLVE